MKRFAYALCGGLLLLSACGISQKQQTQMENSLSVALTDAFLQQDDFVAFAPKVELSDVVSGSAMGWDCAYHGSFSCSFDDRDSHVVIAGVAGFGEDGRLLSLPNGKLAISVPSVLVDYNRVSSDTSIYNLPCFDLGR